MTIREILEQYRKDVSRKITGKPENGIHLSQDQAESAINEYIAEVIGEDEEESITTPDGDDTLSSTNVDRNILREEQRKRAGL